MYDSDEVKILCERIRKLIERLEITTNALESCGIENGQYGWIIALNREYVDNIKNEEDL